LPILIADAQVELAGTADPMTGALDVGSLIDEYLAGRSAGSSSQEPGAHIRVETILVAGSAAEMIYEPDVRLHHRHVVAAIRAAEGGLVGAMTFNPLLNLDHSLAELHRLINMERFRAVRLAPGAHGYLPHRCGDLLGPLCEEAASLEIPLLITGGNPPYATPVLFADLVAAHPRTQFALCGLGSGRVSYA
jgi:predicted TIM-barrel fold metal-dependent hydrolase